MSLRYHMAVSLIHVSFFLGVMGKVFESNHKKLSKFALRIGGVDEEKAKREQDEEWAKKLEEINATPPDKYSIDLTTWKGNDGSPVVELLEISPERYSAFKYAASAKHTTVEAFLGDVVRKAVAA